MNARVRYWPQVLTGWAFATMVILLTSGAALLRRDYPDPDDILRLLEVRDLLAGQSWWDVDQHRLQAGQMHWSRLVDLPIAGVELLARPFVSIETAEHVALGVVPLLTLLAVMALIAKLTRRLLDAEHAGYALILAPLSVPLVYQLRPMRIDHHGWQVACALLALAALLAPRANLRSGLVAGGAIAALLTISLEGLPIAAALLGLAALAWALHPERRKQFAGAAASTFLVSLALHIVTRGPAVLAPACDALAPVWLAILGVGAAGAAIAVQLGARALTVRLAALAAVAVAAIATLYAVDPRCAQGPFGMLNPVVRELWYEKVSEGLPIWEQVPVWAVMMIGMPLVGVVGMVRALRDAAPEQRAAWWMMLGAALAALVLSLMVSRAAATANAFAIPGTAYVVLALLKRARQIRRIVPRLGATAGALMVASPGLAAIPLLGMPEEEHSPATLQRLADPVSPSCISAKDPLALSVLPPAVLFAPIDIAPEIIAGTHHRAITSGHHRNAAAMRDVMLAFTGSPERMRAAAARYGAAYIVGCPASVETELYQNVAPDGMWARLERGERFPWLERVAIAGSPVLAWRVIRHLPEPTRRP